MLTLRTLFKGEKMAGSEVEGAVICAMLWALNFNSEGSIGYTQKS